jgi:hypothetical protein
MEKVQLKCVKIGSKLRIRILTPGYYNNANCQFPRNLRLEGRLYEVDANAITLITRSKNYYSITKSIKILSDVEESSNVRIFEDSSSDECAICMTNDKCIIIVPCGHYYTCASCTAKINKCPICRIKFTKTIDKSQMD